MTVAPMATVAFVGRVACVSPALGDPIALKGTEPEVIRAIRCLGSAVHRNPR